MAIGIAALLDDIAALARLAAASVDDISAAAGRASAKAAGVVIDDAAVTPQYVQGITAKRELPIIRKIATGSLRNKLLFILPIALLLSEIAPWALTPLLMVGGTYLCYEGAEKIYEYVSGHQPKQKTPAAIVGPQAEQHVVSSAVRTDFILSAEIMVISLNTVTDEPLVRRGIVLAVVAVFITVLVYGVVGLIVKMDDVGLSLAQRDSEGAQRLGQGLVKAMPIVLKTLMIVGVAAMLWVGGHIWLVGLDDLGWGMLYDAVHHLEEGVHDVGGIGGFLGWLTNTIASAILGLIVGAVAVAVMHVLPFGPGGHDNEHDEAASH